MSIIDPKTRTLSRKPTEERKMAGPAQSRTVKHFCRDCNSGWMSVIEQAAQPTLAQLIDGAQPTLTAEQLAAIAAWATLKTIVGEYTGPESRCVSDAERARFFETRTPLENWTIELAANASKRTIDYAHNFRGPQAAGAVPHAQSVQTTALFMGFLFVYCRSSTATPGHDGVTFTYDPAPGLVRIWPSTGESLDWAQVRPISPWLLDEIAVSLENAAVWIDEVREPTLEG